MGNGPQIQGLLLDLDDTLHLFREASAKAMEPVYQALGPRGVERQSAESAFRTLMAAHQPEEFTSGEPSRVHRLRRFGRMLDLLGLEETGLAEECVRLYGDAMRLALRPQVGAVELLQFVWTRSLRVAVVTEGPEDAQRLAVEQLGLGLYVDCLVTSGGERLAKTHGLLERACQRLGLAASSCLMVGDSFERDILPASALGAWSIWLSPVPQELPWTPGFLGRAPNLQAVREWLAALLEVGDS